MQYLELDVPHESVKDLSHAQGTRTGMEQLLLVASAAWGEAENVSHPCPSEYRILPLTLVDT
eukprot:755211-Hanusia_phi.AAC.2